jgi:hypothetical protein
MAIVMSTSAVAEIPDKAGCAGLKTAQVQQAKNPTEQDDFNSSLPNISKDRC